MEKEAEAGKPGCATGLSFFVGLKPGRLGTCSRRVRCPSVCPMEAGLLLVVLELFRLGFLFAFLGGFLEIPDSLTDGASDFGEFARPEYDEDDDEDDDQFRHSQSKHGSCLLVREAPSS